MTYAAFLERDEYREESWLDHVEPDAEALVS